MRNPTSSALPLALPAIGAPWPGIDGIYAGLSRGEDGEPDGHLILLNAKPTTDLPWQRAVEWAQGLGDGARLPTRFESALLYANLRDQLDTGSWHWTGTQYSDSYAWGQSFSYGTQDDLAKKFEGRCRAVRRFPLQSFNPSTITEPAPQDGGGVLREILAEIRGARADFQKVMA